MTRERLDRLLVARGLAPTRSRARDLIRRGAVSADGGVLLKPGALIAGAARVSVDERAGAGRVSRGALKLEAALDAFGFDASGRIALDIGASTGGFTQILLERGAARVYAVDVGHGQLHSSLRMDKRVVSIEGCDARDLDMSIVPEPIAAIVADVSFISLTKAAPNALALARRGAWLIALVKPQFEVGPERVGRGGVVRDEAAVADAVAAMRAWVAGRAGWRVMGVMPSPIEGGSGNREFLLGAVLES